METKTKKTLVLGASSKPERYSYKAIKLLRQYGYEVVAIGLKNETIFDVEIQTGKPHFDDIHTVTMYLGPANQKDVEDYILSLHPKRVIFNPGTENYQFINTLEKNGIEVVEYCTLILLNQGAY